MSDLVIVGMVLWVLFMGLVIFVGYKVFKYVASMKWSSKVPNQNNENDQNDDGTNK